MGKYMIIRKEEYERMKNSIDGLIEINSSFSKTIRESEQEILSRIGYLQDNNNVVLDKLQMTENARRTNAGKIGGLTTELNKKKKKVEELENTVKDLETKYEESMSDKYLVKKLPAGRRPRTQTMKLKSCTVQSNIARKMFGDNKWELIDLILDILILNHMEAS